MRPSVVHRTATGLLITGHFMSDVSMGCAIENGVELGDPVPDHPGQLCQRGPYGEYVSMSKHCHMCKFLLHNIYRETIRKRRCESEFFLEHFGSC